MARGTTENETYSPQEVIAISKLNDARNLAQKAWKLQNPDTWKELVQAEKMLEELDHKIEPRILIYLQPLYNNDILSKDQVEDNYGKTYLRHIEQMNNSGVNLFSQNSPRTQSPKDAYTARRLERSRRNQQARRELIFEIRSLGTSLGNMKLDDQIWDELVRIFIGHTKRGKTMNKSAIKKWFKDYKHQEPRPIDQDSEDS